jgi:hypothetical protein
MVAVMGDVFALMYNFHHVVIFEGHTVRPVELFVINLGLLSSCVLV